MDISKLLGLKKEKNIKNKVSDNNTFNNTSFINNDKLTLENTGTYKRIIELLPEEALSNLPNEVFKCLGFNFIEPFKEALIKMRKSGLAYLIYAKDNTREGLFLPDELDNFRAEQDSNTKIFEYFLEGKIINPNTVLVFGDQLRTNKAKLHITDCQEQTILRYEKALEIFYKKLDNSYAWIIKLAGYNNKFSFNSNNDEIEGKITDIAKRTANSVIHIDKEDDFQIAQMDLNWFPDFIKEYKTKICVDFNIPFTKFFGEAATGFNATGEGDRRSWYDTVKSYQALYIFSNLKQYATLINKDAEFNKIDLESIEIADKEAEANIQSLELNNIINAHNNGLIDDDVAQKTVLKILNLNQLTNGVKND